MNWKLAHSYPQFRWIRGGTKMPDGKGYTTEEARKKAREFTQKVQQIKRKSTFKVDDLNSDIDGYLKKHNKRHKIPGSSGGK